MTTSQEIARRVLGIIPSHHHWTKHNYRLGGRYCVVGALERLGYNSVDIFGFASVFYEIALDQHPRIDLNLNGEDAGVNAIIYVNDASGIRYADIRVILEKIAARED